MGRILIKGGIKMYRVFVQYRNEIKSYFLNGDNIDAELTNIQESTDFVRVIQIIYLGELPV